MINPTITAIAAISTLVAVILSSVCYKRSLNKLIQKIIRFGVPIAQVFSFFVFVVAVFVIYKLRPDVSTNSSEIKKIDEVFGEISTRINGSMETLKTIDFSPYDNARAGLPPNFNALAVDIVSGISGVQSHDYIVLIQKTANTAIQMEQQISRMTTTCSRTEINADGIITAVDEVKTRIDNIIIVAASKLPGIVTNRLVNEKPNVIAKIAEEKVKVTKHLDNIKDFYNELLQALQTHKLEINSASAVRGAKLKSQVEAAEVKIVVLSICAAVIAFLVLVHRGIQFRINNPVLRVSNYLVLAFLIGVTAVFIFIQFLVPENFEKCERSAPPLFQPYIPIYHASTDALKSCDTENDVLFAGLKSGIFVSESTALVAFSKSADGDIATFQTDNQVNFVEKKSDLESSYSTLKEFYKNGCFSGQDNTTIGEYIEQLDEVRDGLTAFESEVKMLIKDLPNKSHSVITKALEPINLQVTIDAIDNGIQKSNFDCSTVVVPFKAFFDSDCETGRGNLPITTENCLSAIILLFSAYILLTGFTILPGKVKRNAEGYTASEVERQNNEKREREQKQKDAFSSWVKEVLNTPFEEMGKKYAKMHEDAVKEKSIRKKELMQTYLKYADRIPRLNQTKIPIYDKNRVIIQNREIDYINASMITLPNSGKKYILAQGPRPNTVSQFLAMCLQENIKIIVMLTSLVEPDRKENKCAPYFPQTLNETLTFDEFEITCTEKKEHPDLAVFWRVLKLVNKRAENSTPLFIDHVLAAWWPDQSVPEDPHPTINLRNWLKTVHKDNSPICVHCSAGLGRTGTFVFIDYAIDTIQDKKRDTVEMLREFRTYRYGALQRLSQLIYSIICILEIFVRDGRITRESTREYFEMYKRWRKLQILQELANEAKKEEKEKKEEEEKKKKETGK